jgi:hypothetical protein
VDRLTLTIYGTDTSLDQRSTIGGLYAEIYTEPPYNEGPADAEDFTSGWSRTIDQRNFRLVMARQANEPIGFGFRPPASSPDKMVARRPDTATR